MFRGHRTHLASPACIADLRSRVRKGYGGNRLTTRGESHRAGLPRWSIGLLAHTWGRGTGVSGPYPSLTCSSCKGAPVAALATFPISTSFLKRIDSLRESGFAGFSPVLSQHIPL